MAAGSIDTRLHATFERFMQGRNLFGGTVRLETEAGSFAWEAATGDLAVGDQYFLASTTKLYVTAVLLSLRSQGKLDLDELLVSHVPADLVVGIHHRKRDASGELTIRHLMSHTSGLPDYFQQKRADGSSLEKEITAGRDQTWTLDDVLEATGRMKPPFAPGAPGKAFYSDTNYQLLGKVIETVTGDALEEVFRGLIYDPLSLTDTYLYTDPSDERPHHLYYQDHALRVPLAMASFGPDGGVVSTASESMTFLKAFFTGALFPADYLPELYHWNKIFFPLQYGVGIMRFQLPRYLSPFSPAPELVGHSGLSGAFAFYAPDRGLYCTGTINQVAQPGRSFRLLLRLLNQLR
ncbi:MAG: beta-lactamase family protein [Acidimicrobiia bacterium]|nr:beta-lactamase family protein [Acidimicrobiia bacterium]